MFKKIIAISLWVSIALRAMEVPQSYDQELLELSCSNENIERIIWLINAGANINFQGPSLLVQKETTPLFNAVYKGNSDIVRALLKAPNLAINREYFGQHILHYAMSMMKVPTNALARRNIAESILYDPRTNLSFTNNNGQSLLHDAIACGLEHIIIFLLQKAPHLINVQDKTGITPLHNASMYSNGKAIELLLKMPGIKADICDHYGRTPAQIAAQSKDLNLINFFAKEPTIDIHKTDRLGNTPLHLAAFNGSVETVSSLIASGANINSRNNQGNTPLHNATQRGHAQIVALLLNTPGIHIGITNNLNHTALQYAIQHGTLEVVQLFLDLPGINVNIKNETGQTLLHLAAQNRNSGVLALLLTILTNNINTTDKHGQTPLSIACTHAIEENIKLLLSLPTINTYVPGTNDMPLLASCLVYRSSFTIIQMLLLHGLTLNDSSPIPRGNMITTRISLQESLKGMFSHKPLVLSSILGSLEEVKLYANDRSSEAELIEALEYAIAQRQEAVVKYLAQLLLNKNTGLLTNALSRIEWLIQVSEYKHKYQELKILIQSLKPNKPLPPLPKLPKAKPKPQTLLGQARQSQNLNERQGSVYFEMPNNEHVAQKISTNALLTAVNQKDIATIKKLISEEQVDINFQNEEGNTTIHIASAIDDPQMLPLLFNFKNVDLTITNDQGQTPLMLALTKKNESAIVTLICFGAEFHKHELLQTIFSKKPLIAATIIGDLAKIKLLIPMVNDNNQIKDALLYAITFGQLHIISYYMMYLTNTGNSELIKEALIHVQKLLTQKLPNEKIVGYQKIENILLSYVKVDTSKSQKVMA